LKPLQETKRITPTHPAPSSTGNCVTDGRSVPLACCPPLSRLRGGKRVKGREWTHPMEPAFCWGWEAWPPPPTEPSAHAQPLSQSHWLLLWFGQSPCQGGTGYSPACTGVSDSSSSIRTHSMLCCPPGDETSRMSRQDGRLNRELVGEGPGRLSVF
jgi:hypothetical protein